MKKKKVIFCIAGISVYSLLALGLCFQQYRSEVHAIEQENEANWQQQVLQDQENDRQNSFRVAFNEAVENREYVSELPLLMYNEVNPDQLYVENDRLLLREEDKTPVLTQYNMPMLQRMDAEGNEKYMSELQVLQRIDALEIDPNLLNTPEYDWKVVYADSIQTVKAATTYQASCVFTGETASELNIFLKENVGKTVILQTEQLLLDEPIEVPGNIALDGNHVKVFTSGSKKKWAILVDGVSNVSVMNFNLEGCSKQGIFVVNSDKVLVCGNYATGLSGKSICIMDKCSYVNLVNNHVYDNGEGGFFVNGDISNCIFQGNEIYDNKGTRNLMAGIVFSAMPVPDPYNVKNPFPDEYLYEQLEAPHQIVVLDNSIRDNYSSGIYCDGGYQMYIISNNIEDNEKEGICLDYGSFGDYISENTILRNGERNRQSDNDLKSDFVYEAGRLEDGSAPFKLPGISIDNAAYNIVSNNSICDNSGSGVKMVRSAYRNIVVSNQISNNNRGQNEKFHGFGVEIGYASEPDEPVIGLDFTPGFENIVTRNVIQGKHFSGVFLAVESYCNDIYNNLIMDAEEFAIEIHSGFFNSQVDNICNGEIKNFAN